MPPYAGQKEGRSGRSDCPFPQDPPRGGRKTEANVRIWGELISSLNQDRWECSLEDRPEEDETLDILYHREYGSY